MAESTSRGKEEVKSQVNIKGLKRLGFVPIPLLLVLTAVLNAFEKKSAFYDPAWLIPITNTLFVTAICLAVAWIALRNYRATGRIQILLLGCGVLIFGIGGLIAGFVRGLPDGANLNVTIYNIGALVGALFHFAAAMILVAGVAPEAGTKRKGAWLAAGYPGVILFMALLTVASLRGVTPPFFIQGQGPTFLRQAVLGSADILFAFSFLIFLATYLRNREEFLYWYSLALALTAISLTAFFIQHAVGSPVGWTGRCSQYLGGVYFLAAILTAMRNAAVRKSTFDNIVTTSLSSAEDKFRALAENSPDIIDRFDRELRHIYVNQAGLRLYGKPAHAIIGKTIGETGIHVEYCDLWKERIQQTFATGRNLEAEVYFPTPDGPRFYQSRFVPEFDADCSVIYVLVVSRDLTEHKAAEAQIEQLNQDLQRRVAEQTAEIRHGYDALRVERQRLYDVLETLPAMICLLTPDYHIPFINKSFRDKFGEVQGRRCYEYCYGKAEPCDFCESFTVLKTGQPHHWEVTGPNGSIISAHDFPFTDVDGSPLILEMNIDITGRRRADEALKLAVAYNRSLIEASLDPLVTIGHDGKIMDVNTATETATGLTRDELIGTDFCDYFSEPENARMGYEKVFREGSVRDYPLELRNRDGSVTSVLYNATVYRDENGEVIGIFAAARDITERKRAEEALRELNVTLEQRVAERTAQLQASEERLRQALDELEAKVIERTRELREKDQMLIAQSRHAAMGEMLGNIAHQWRQPLNSVGIIVQTLTLLHDTGELDRDNLASIENQVMELIRHMSHTIDDFRNFFRPDKNKTEFSVRKAVESTVSLVEASFKSRLIVTEIVMEEDPVINGYKNEYSQALLNILHNARDAVESGEIRDPKVSIGIGRVNGRSVVTIADNAGGIPAEIMHKIFDPYFTTKGPDKGTGVGLFMSKAIIEKNMGGRLTARNTDDGAEFTIEV